MNKPIQQSIPIVLIFALVLWASSSLTYYYSRYLFEIEVINNLYIYIVITASIFVILLVILIYKIQKSRFVFIILISVFLGVLLSLIAANNLNLQVENISKFNKETLVFEALEDQKNSSYNNTCVSKIVSNNINWKIKLQYPQDFDEIHAGDILKVNANYIRPNDSQIDNYWQNGICASGKTNRIEKISRNDLLAPIYKYRNHLIDIIRNFDWDENSHSQAEQLLCAIICGQRIDLNSGDLYDSFKCAGLAHLVAVSGAHLSLVTAILLIFLKKLKLKKWKIIFIQSIFIFAYLICAAVPISALRAAFMAYVAIFSFFSKRRPAPLNALGICIIILIALNPQTCISVSFALSAGSTLGIIIFSRLFEYWILNFIKKCPQLISSATALTFSAGICSQPLSISIFMQLPLIAPISNIICTPIFTLLCGWGLIATVFSSIFYEVLPIISKIFMWLAYITSEFLAQVVRVLSALPYASIPASMNTIFAVLLSFIICFLLYKTWPTSLTKLKNIRSIKKFWYLGICLASVCLLIIFLIPKSSGTELIVLDVGQGDSILLKSKGKNFLIDTGNQDNLLKTRLAEQGINHLDGLLITHPDDDHCGSCDVIEQLIVVDKVYIAKDLVTCNDANCQKLTNQIRKIVQDSSIEKMSVGDKICFGEIELDVIWPDKYTDNGGNADSLCVMANIDIANDDEIDARALLCGDAEYNEIDKMLSKGRIPKLDIYKCGHHGSKNALSDESVKKLDPKISLISVGSKNRYGHPANTTLQKLENCGSRIYRTDQQGTIDCKFNTKTIDITTDK